MSKTAQGGFFDGEIVAARAELAAHDAAIQAERARRFEARKAELRGDTGAWKGGEFSERLEAMLDQLDAAGEGAREMRDAILLGVNAAANQNRLGEAHVAFVEDKARKEIARVSAQGRVVPVVWEPRTPADLVVFHPAAGQLPNALQQAAVDAINSLGADLAQLGFKSELEVDASCPRPAEDVARGIKAVHTAVTLLGVARYRSAKGYRSSSENRLALAEQYASEVLGFDTTAHPGVGLDQPLTADGLRQPPQPRQARETLAEVAEIRAAAPAGVYIGKVVELSDDRLVQKIGRDPRDLVAHDRHQLDCDGVKVGDVVTVSYEMGLGRLSDRRLDRDGPAR